MSSAACLPHDAAAQSSAGASSNRISLSITTEAGVLDGLAKEFVYDQGVSPDYIVSELDWQLQPVFYWGAGIDLGYRQWYAELNLKSGVSGESGSITDSDFLDGNGVKTNFSESNAYTEQALLADLTVGWKVEAFPGMKLGLFVSGDYMDFKWTAQDGYYQYPSTGSEYSYNANGSVVYGTYPAWSASESKVPIYGTAIVYEQAYIYPAVGVSAEVALARRLTLGASFSYSPLVYCSDEDDHELRLLDFFSAMGMGTMIEPKLDLTYRFSERAALELSASYRVISGLLGNEEVENVGTADASPTYPYAAGPGTVVSYPESSGASYSTLDASLSFRLGL